MICAEVTGILKGNGGVRKGVQARAQVKTYYRLISVNAREASCVCWLAVIKIGFCPPTETGGQRPCPS